MFWIKEIAHEFVELIKTLPVKLRATCVILTIVLVAGWFYMDRVYDHMEMSVAVNDKRSWTDDWEAKNYWTGEYENREIRATATKQL